MLQPGMSSAEDGLCSRGSVSGSPSPGGPWLPSHVQVGVLGARGLRGKGGLPAGDAFALLQLGRQKVRTAVAPDRTGCPRWSAPPWALELPSAAPATQSELGPEEPGGEALVLRVTVLQRALVGPDRFLGTAALPLGQLLHRARREAHTQWFQLHSKPGKKEKDRGEVELSLQFTRHSLTASMFDLSAKEKPRSPFGKLKDKMKGRHKYELESASAVVPSSYGALEDEGPGLEGGRKGPRLPKAGFFFKGKLRRSSLTRSNTSLGSDSTLSSAGSLAGSAGNEALAPSPARHGSFSTDRSVRDFLPSPKLTHKRAFSDEASQVALLPESKSVQSLKPSGKEPISRSSLCINGSHIYCEEPPPKPSFLSSPSAPAAPQKPPDEGPRGPDPEMPTWSGVRGQKGPPKDPPRFIPSPPILAAQEEDKLSVKTIALNKQRGRAKKEEALRAEGRPVQMAAPLVFSSEVVRVRPQERAPKTEQEEEEEKRKARTGFFRRRSSSKDSGTGPTRVSSESGDPQASPGPASAEERGRSSSASGWFGRQDTKERRPSSHPGLLPAAAEPPPRFPSGPDPQRPTAAAPSSEWDDSFDAFATSRLKPDAESPRTDTPDPDASQGDLLPKAPDAETPRTDSPDPDASQGEPLPKAPDLLDFVSEEGRLDNDATLTSYLEAPPNPREGNRTAEEGGLASLRGAEWTETPERISSEDPSQWVGSLESGFESQWVTPASGHHSPVVIHPGVGSEDVSSKGPESSIFESHWATPAAHIFPSSVDVHPGVELPAGLAGEPATRSFSAFVGTWETNDVEREEEGGALVSKTQAVSGAESHTDLNAGHDVDDEREDGELHECRRAETPPPKPPRRFTPLSLQEEAGEAIRGQPESGEDEAVPCEEGEPPTETVLLSPKVMIGVGVNIRAIGRLQLAPEPTGANETPQEIFWGDTTAEQLPLSAGKSRPSEEAADAGCLEEGDGGWVGSSTGTTEATEVPGLAGAGSMAPTEELRWPVEASGQPSQTLSSSAFFWTALEEQHVPPSQDRRSRKPPDEERFPVEEETREEPSSVGLSEGSPAGTTSSPAPYPASGFINKSEASSIWSDDQVLDFKRADFWQAERGERCPDAGTPGNPFAPRPPLPSPQNNPFVERPPDVLPDPAAVLPFPHQRGPLFSTVAPEEGPALTPSPVLPGLQPLAFSTPFLQGGPNPGLSSPVAGPTTTPIPLATSQTSTDPSAPSVLPVEMWREEEGDAKAGTLQQKASPHPVKPISSTSGSAVSREEKPQPAVKAALVRSCSADREKLQSSSVKEAVVPILQLGKTEAEKDPSSDPAAQYYHLTHEELVQLLRKREAELRKEKAHVRELENYIDRLLVRIMEQSPTLLQISLRDGGEAKPPAK
ncbi:rab11 family-interacting protein 5 [Anolis carolinensis]|uniref:rab11 family-interacting protein 5 n=1 Tax=Anolis carolinensis TaxID=28377 RepID=UPI002F2B4FF9